MADLTITADWTRISVPRFPRLRLWLAAHARLRRLKARRRRLLRAMGEVDAHLLADVGAPARPALRQHWIVALVQS